MVLYVAFQLKIKCGEGGMKFFISFSLSLFVFISTMSLLLSDIHLPALITSTLSEYAPYHALPWNNLDQLSCLWGGKSTIAPEVCVCGS